MKICGQIPWNVRPICETFKISCLIRKLHTKGVLENHLKDQSFRLVHWLNRHHVEPRVKLYSPREESFPIPMKLTSPDLLIQTLMLCKNVASMTIGTSMRQEICLILGQVSLSFTVLEQKPLDGYMCSGRRLTKREVTSRPDYLWSELWTILGRNVKLKERHIWAIEKPKLDNARKLRGIHFIGAEDKEFKETIKNAPKKLETPMAPAMPCKTSKKCKHGEKRGKTSEFKSKLACILEASESTRLRMEESLPNYYEDHIAGKGEP